MEATKTVTSQEFEIMKAATIFSIGYMGFPVFIKGRRLTGWQLEEKFRESVKQYRVRITKYEGERNPDVDVIEYLKPSEINK